MTPEQTISFASSVSDSRSHSLTFPREIITNMDAETIENNETRCVRIDQKSSAVITVDVSHLPDSDDEYEPIENILGSEEI